MNYPEIEAFLAIVEKENFTDAAKSLFISQPTLSHRLFRLESKLGIRLIERKKGCKNIVLTGSGREFITTAKNWQILMQDIEALKYATPDKLKLSIGTVDTFHALIFPPLYNLLEEKHPYISLNLRTYNSAELYQQVERGELDVAFTLLNIPVKNMLITPVYREPRVILVREDSKSFEYDTLNLKQLDLQKERFFIGDVNFNNWYRVWKGRLGYASVQVDTVQILNFFMQQEGNWAIVPFSIAQAWSKKGGYNWYHLDSPAPERLCYRIQPQYLSANTAKAIAIFDSCLEEISDEISLKQL